MKKLLLVAPNSVHTFNYIELISGYFDEILLITNRENLENNTKTIVLNFSLKKISNHFSTPNAIRNVIENYKPSLIHVHQANSYAYYSLKANKKTNIPIVVSAWGSDILLSPKRNEILKRITKYILENSSAFTSDSKYMAEEMRKITPKLKLDITIANFGIEMPKTIVEKENIIYSNRLHKPLYRINKIIRAFKIFNAAQNNSWRLIIAGSGEETESLKLLSTSLFLNKYVEFTGWLGKEKNNSFYAKSKIFVSIPESDATSISLLEAISYSCIPIVSDLPANQEWINDMTNGFVVKNVDTDFFTEASKINFEKASEINKELTEKYSTKEVNRDKFLSLYDRLIK